MKKKLLCMLLVLTFVLSAAGCKGKNNTSAGKPAKISSEAKDLIAQADELYEAGSYQESLDLYLDAMDAAPQSVEARAGVIRCQIAEKDYSLAYTNLQFLAQISPYNIDVYDLYMELSVAQDNISIAKSAVLLAEQYGIDEFLDRLPEEPVLATAGGSYEEKIMFDAVMPADGARLVISMDSESGLGSGTFDYAGAFPLPQGRTDITAYMVVDGYPSKEITETFYCNYEPSAVSFADPWMERLVRVTLGIGEYEPITDVDCMSVEKLYYNDLHAVYDLNSDQMKIRSLTDLYYMPYLKDLDLSRIAAANDLSPICSCPMLTDFAMRDCGLRDIGFISSLKKLRYIDVRYNEIADFSPLRGLTELYMIAVNDNPGTNLTFLDEFPKLNYLYVDTKAIQDFSTLWSCEQLVDLELYGFEGLDGDAISRLTSLTSLVIIPVYDYSLSYEERERQELKDLSFIQPLKNLEELYLDHVNDSSQLTYLMELTNLKRLRLYQSQATEDTYMMQQLYRALPNCDISY